MTDKDGVNIILSTPRYFDRSAQDYRELELPTKTVQIRSRTKQGTAIDSVAGEVNMGSIAFTGSHQDYAPGSFSLRVLRRTISYGSMATNGQLYWYLHHSRLGTIDTMGFRVNTSSPMVHHGDQLAPLYSLGPGTITMRMKSLKGTHRIATSMEGMF